MKKIALIGISLFGIIGVGVFAADTIIQNLTGLTSDNAGSFVDQKSSSLSDLKLVNEGGNNNPIGDYFVGHYADPAYGVFDMNTQSGTNGSRVEIGSENNSVCTNSTTHQGFKLTGQAYSETFGFMNFDGVYICIPKGLNLDDTLTTYMGGYAYSPLLGYQNFDGWIFDSTVDICDLTVNSDCNTDDSAVGRLVKIEGNTSSGNNQEGLTTQFDDDVRIIGNISKPELRAEIEAKVYQVIRNANGADGGTVTNFSGDTWNNSNPGTKLLGDTVLYFSGDSDVTLGATNNLSGTKTIVVESGDVNINGNITGNGILGIIALDGDIFIRPTVTDIRATLYTNKSLRSSGDNLYTSNEDPTVLKNQLYINGSVFSNNTIGGSLNGDCPFYVSGSTCGDNLSAQKYDLNFLRRYVLVQPIGTDGSPDGDKIPQYGGAQSSLLVGTNVEFPVVIEYDPRVQQTPPPLFD